VRTWKVRSTPDERSREESTTDERSREESTTDERSREESTTDESVAPTSRVTIEVTVQWYGRGRRIQISRIAQTPAS
jgi:hypothetical protein